MSDWRKSPRTGRSQFVPLIDEIKLRKSQGETLRQIYDHLHGEEKLKISYVQFTKYVKKFIIGQASLKPKPHESNQARINPLNKISESVTSRRNRDTDIYNPVPDKKRIYGDED